MPKIVDREKRKEMIAEATWQVILKQGMKGATVRNIAKEAQLSLGALRHYFSTQEELYMFAMKLVKERVLKRIEKIVASDLPPKEKFISVLEQLLPMDEESRAEMEVWLHFTNYFLGNEKLLDDGIREGIEKALYFLECHQLLKDNIDIEIETERLHALVDGLALHRIMDKNRPTNEMMRQILTKHVETLLK